MLFQNTKILTFFNTFFIKKFFTLEYFYYFYTIKLKQQIMKTLKNIINVLYFFSLSFALVLGAMMHYFGNSYGKYVLLVSVLFASYEVYKNDKE